MFTLGHFHCFGFSIVALYKNRPNSKQMRATSQEESTKASADDDDVATTTVRILYV